MDNELLYKTHAEKFTEHPIQTFDAMVLLCRTPKLYEGLQKRAKKLLLRCILILSGTLTSSDDENVEELAKGALDHHSLLKNKKIVAACYLRLLSEESCQWASLPPWRPKIIELLDSALASETYHEWKVPDGMAHEKAVRLSEAVHDQEQLLKEAIETLTSFEMLSKHRQNIMALLNSKSGKVLFQPFLPEHFGSKLGEVYKVLERYWSQREDVGIIDTHTSTISEIQCLKTILANFGTIYSQNLANTLVEKFLWLVEDDFSKNKAAQPANMKAEARNKKYPLHFVGEFINLGIIVRNLGTGYAHNTRLIVCSGSELYFTNPEVEIGRLAPSVSQLIEIRAKIIEAKPKVTVLAQVTWQDFDHTDHRFEFEFEAMAQRSDIDWVALRQKDPYSLEPVVNELELVGRRDVLNRLLASAKAINAGSSIIHGQKRVGKTSIAKTLQSHLQDLGYLTVYLEAGDYVMPSAPSTIARLGNKLCQRIIGAETRVSHLPLPDFSQALSPLTDFLDDVSQIIPDRRIAIILDEFDELPSELYVRGTWGDSFFLTLRSITSRSNISFVLVGGEKMAHIMDYQGDQLNKWAVIQVDYFSRETDWTDYKEMVQRPVQDLLEYTEDALVALHEKTAGNPYFTKLICQYVFRQALSKRDCYITHPEIEQAADIAIQETEKNTFQHFWEDGLIELDEKATERSIRRRKVLIASSDALLKASPAPGKIIAEHPIVHGLATLEADLREFVTRKVLIGNISENFPEQVFEFKVKFFHEWLRGRGVQDVISTFAELDAAMRERQQEEQIKVQPAEIHDLVKNWGQYRGQSISEDKVRGWLNQFTNMREQRWMMNILRGVHYYSNAFIRGKMAEVHDIVVRGLSQSRKYRQVKRSDILVSYIDSVGKSGAALARLYAEEAKIYIDNVVEKGSLAEALTKNEEVQALVFVDDFIGTGQQASENMESIHKLLEHILVGRQIKLFFVVIAAYIQGYRKVKDTIERLKLPFEIRACEVMQESCQFFGEQSSAFRDPVERENAKKVAQEYGKALVRDNPLGYGDLGIAVVFEHSCPNDTLPILWAESNNPKWMPLFRRL